MKKLLCLVSILAFITFFTECSAQGMLGKLKDKVKQKTQQRVEQNEDKAIDKGLDKVDPSKTNNSSNKDNASNTNADNSGVVDNNTAGKNQPAVPTLHTYQNYDFVPGDTILFADDFTSDQDGEFPSHWDLDKGQGAVNKVLGIPAMTLTEGNYARISPLMKTKSYLTDPFTIECDYMVNNGGAYGINIFLKGPGDKEGHINYNEHGNVSSAYFQKDFSADYPDHAAKDDEFYNKWHHIAIIYKNHQIKCYLDQYRVLVMPNVDFVPISIQIGGIGDQEKPIVFTNLRVASGGNMNMIGQKFTESKIVTHGINFDIDKATIKPESMGTLNMIVNILKNNPEVKFEIDGHTDNSGAAQHNLDLSQQRADAVKMQLVNMGIDASRLTTKGFGDTKPISDNSTMEGKANNRRVEFVKM